MFNDVQTCISKDLRQGFEGHDVVEISWETHSTHGMYMYVENSFLQSKACSH